MGDMAFCVFINNKAHICKISNRIKMSWTVTDNECVSVVTLVFNSALSLDQ